MFKKAPFLLVIAFGLIAIMMQQSYGQATTAFQQTLTEMNRMKPFQNPIWQRSADVMKSRILDRKNKTMGDLKDIILTGDGKMSSLKVELSRMQFETDIFLNAQELKFISNDRAFVMQYDEAEIKDLYPQLLADIETAGGATSDSISLDSLQNADVRAEDGRNLGKVEEVLFARNGGDAAAIMIRVRYKTISGQSVAVPFSSLKYQPDGTTFKVVVPNDQADDILKFADR
jgi:sporulation protein YlmC with PRC-barrel domain